MSPRENRRSVSPTCEVFWRPRSLNSASLTPLTLLLTLPEIRGRNSVVECQLPKLDVAGSSPVARSDCFISVSASLHTHPISLAPLITHRCLRSCGLASGAVPRLAFRGADATPGL